MTYTVREGDTVAQIARLFQCSVPQLLAWNGLSSKSAHPRRAEAAHPPRQRATAEGPARFRRAPRAAALCGIIRAGGLQPWVF